MSVNDSAVLQRRSRTLEHCGSCNRVMFVYASVKAQGRGKFCSSYCYQREKQKLKKPAADRLLSHVRKDEAGCWLWTSVIRYNGYGDFYFRGRMIGAHRAAFIIFKGEIPDGKILDHLCRVRHCVNPDHLEPVTHRENTRRGNGFPGIQSRKTHCPRGHELAGSNLVQYIKRHGHRVCRECANAYQRLQYKNGHRRRKTIGSSP